MSVDVGTEVNLENKKTLSEIDYDLSNNMSWEVVFISLSEVGVAGEDGKISDDKSFIKDEFENFVGENLHLALDDLTCSFLH